MRVYRLSRYLVTEDHTDLLASYSTSAQLMSIENLISVGAPLNVTLRLLCLASITMGGIKPKVLEGIKREILQVSNASLWW